MPPVQEQIGILKVNTVNEKSNLMWKYFGIGIVESMKFEAKFSFHIVHYYKAKKSSNGF